eukprot:2002386-Amphidinium_carterae.1
MLVLCFSIGIVWWFVLDMVPAASALGVIPWFEATLILICSSAFFVDGGANVYILESTGTQYVFDCATLQSLLSFNA